MDLTDADILAILDEDSVTFLSWSTEGFSDVMVGFLGDHKNIYVKFCREDGFWEKRRYFAKALTTTLLPAQIRMIADMRAFSKETFFYSHLVPEFQRFGLDTDFLPHCRLVRENLLVFQHLADLGYQTQKTATFFTFDMCKSGVEALAKLHAASISYEELKGMEIERKYVLGKEHPRLLCDRLYVNEPDNLFTALLNGMKVFLDRIVQKSYFGINGGEFSAKISETLSNLYENAKPSPNFRNACVHGDVWSYNILFRSSQPTECKLVDFQFIKYYLPAYDFVIFLLINTSQCFRRENFLRLANIYFDMLSNTLLKHNIDPSEIYTFDQFQKSCYEALKSAKYYALILRTLFFFEQYVECDSSEGLNGYMLHNNAGELVKAYDNVEEYNNFMFDEIIELKNILFDEFTLF